ncbi:MAG: zf-HC2 domain-containing protein, partial [Myxococcota bacterium]
MTRPPPLPRRHAPKLRALEALDAGALSPEGERRLRAHLATCARCQRAQASMHLYGALTGELRAEDALRRRPVDFARMELPLRHEARQQAARARRARSLRRAAPLAVAAAV